MKRSDLINAVNELKKSENIEHDIDTLKDFIVNFCDNYEAEFNRIRYALEGLAPHIDNVQEAYTIADKCSERLY